MGQSSIFIYGPAIVLGVFRLSRYEGGNRFCLKPPPPPIFGFPFKLYHICPHQLHRITRKDKYHLGCHGFRNAINSNPWVLLFPLLLPHLKWTSVEFSTSDSERGDVGSKSRLAWLLQPRWQDVAVGMKSF